METMLKWATIIGGLAAIGYFWDKFAPFCEKTSCFKWGIIVLIILIIVLVIFITIYYFGQKKFHKQYKIKQPVKPVSLDSLFYVERPPVESDGYETIVKSGALIRIKAPRQMGKTSLMMRIFQHGQQQGYNMVSLSFDQIDSTALANLDQFLRWFCISVTRKLNLPADKVANHWSEFFDGMGNCSDYFEKELLTETALPLVLGLDKVDRLFKYEDIARDFFRLLHSWHEESQTGDETWKKLRLVLIHTEDVPISFKIKQSPFNVGTENSGKVGS